MPAERNLFFDHALLPQGWAANVRVQVRDGRFAGVDSNARAAPGDERAHLAIPGIPNVHNHAFQRAMAGLAERRGPQGTDNFWSWREVMYRFMANMEGDDVEAIAAYAYADMLEAGFTSVGEFHYVHRTPQGDYYDNPAELALRHADAAEVTGIGLTLLPVFYAASNFGGAPPTDGQRRFITDLDVFADIVERCGKRVMTGIAPHSLRAVTPNQLTAVTKMSGGKPLHIHAAEQTKEVEDCVAWSGLRPVQWLLRNAPVDARWCLVHSTHVVADEIEGLARSGAVVGLCPVTEANLGDGIFPAQQYLAAGGHFAVGTDSNVLLDAAGELRQLEYSQRLQLRARNVLTSGGQPSTAHSLLNGALAGGAQALGQRVGAIETGARADFLILDEAHPDLGNRNPDAALDTWIFAGGRGLIRSVTAGGVTVVERGRHRLRDQIDQRYRQTVARLLERT